MKFEFLRFDNQNIRLSIPNKSELKDLVKWENIISKLIRSSINNEKAMFVTLNPAQYSISKKLNVDLYLNYQNQDIEIIYLDKLDEEFIQDIIESEDFELGNSFLIVTANREPKAIKETIDNYLQIKKCHKENDWTYPIDDELIFRANDGYYFYWTKAPDWPDSTWHEWFLSSS